MHILIILLGCNVASLLANRILSSLYFIEQHANEFHEITWYLSGGIKYENGQTTLSEAKRMQEQLDTHTQTRGVRGLRGSTRQQHHFILDENAHNTAENLYHSSQYLNKTNAKYDDIYIATSAFHHKRAKRILELIDPSRSYQWILGDAKEPDSDYWETIHIRNVENDVRKLNSCYAALN